MSDRQINNKYYGASSATTMETNENDRIILQIIKDSEVWIIKVYNYQQISHLLCIATCHFVYPTESHSKYKFLSVSQKKILNDQCTVGDEKLKNFDELLLVPMISPSTKEETLTMQDIKGPSQEEITNATANLISKNPVIKMVPKLGCRDCYQSEIFEILCLLVEASATILALNPNAKEFFDEIAARINAMFKKEIDINAIKYLKDLGFTEDEAKYALRLKRNRQVEAMEWLLENSSRVKELVDQAAMFVPSTSSVSSSDNPLHIIKQLLQDLRNFRQQYLEPNSKTKDSKDNLNVIGFVSDAVFSLLRVCGNNHTKANEMLNENGDLDLNLTNSSVSVDTECQLYKALMENPTIQRGLSNPKILFAFLMILENLQSLNMWLSDIDAAPVLGQIFKIYHLEKHNMLAKQQMKLMLRQEIE